MSAAPLLQLPPLGHRFPMGRELRTSDIAARNGIDRRTAHRWLRALHEKYGPAVVARRGKKGIYVTTEDAFASVAPLAPSRGDEDRRFRDVEERTDQIETRIDALAREVSEVKRRASGGR